jgi:hypothetical protein
MAVRSMKVGGIGRVIIPPSLGCQNTSNEPILLSIQRYIQLDSLWMWGNIVSYHNPTYYLWLTMIDYGSETHNNKIHVSYNLELEWIPKSYNKNQLSCVQLLPYQ